MDSMKICLYKDSRGWIADPIKMPGSPTIGIGKTKEKAIINLLKINNKIEIIDDKGNRK
jgi:hypothetical protein